MTDRVRQLFEPDFRTRGVSLGNEFNKHTDKEAEATLEAAWAVGVRKPPPTICSAGNLSGLGRRRGGSLGSATPRRGPRREKDQPFPSP